MPAPTPNPHHHHGPQSNFSRLHNLIESPYLYQGCGSRWYSNPQSLTWCQEVIKLMKLTPANTASELGLSNGNFDQWKCPPLRARACLSPVPSSTGSTSPYDPNPKHSITTTTTTTTTTLATLSTTSPASFLYTTAFCFGTNNHHHGHCVGMRPRRQIGHSIQPACSDRVVMRGSRSRTVH
ncbi:hypothetical protein O3P69_002776 [Scylla paramamosain]|uniref:Uncharacterized protein n=1 Tax=Scylla paramamosain TaxID=85552 RepID=A0AAW0UM74_SCYPA